MFLLVLPKRKRRVDSHVTGSSEGIDRVQFRVSKSTRIALQLINLYTLYDDGLGSPDIEVKDYGITRSPARTSHLKVHVRLSVLFEPDQLLLRS